MAASIITIDGERGTPGRLIKVNHAGECGAVNIYRAQILVSKLLAPKLVPQLEHFLAHEKEHLRIFGDVLAARRIARCRSFLLCGLGGFVLGFLTALLGKSGVMACTAAVETVVMDHLRAQLRFMQERDDLEAYEAVAAIIADEEEHQNAGIEQAQDSVLYRPLCFVVGKATEAVIWSGLRL